MEKVNRENCERLNRFEHINLKNADGTRLRARRNGKTKTWKTRMNNFDIPIKHGLRDYGYIDEINCGFWEGEQ
jgi:hypothetical protein